MRSSWISIREARRMGFNGASVLALAVVLLSFLSVDSFSSNQRLNVRSSSTTVYMAGGRVPLVPYFLGRESLKQLNVNRGHSIGIAGSSEPSFSRSKNGKFAFEMAARGGGQGSTKIDKKTDIDTKTKPTYRDEIEKDWRLILHDDTVHTIQQVCEILGTCCPLCSGPRAYEVTLEVHMTGAGTVAVANKKIVDEYCKSLQMAGLSVSMAPDDDFESDEDVE